MDGGTGEEARVLEAVSRVLRGDTAAFEEIIRTYQRQVLRICGAILRNRQDAEDAAQEVFCRAFRMLRSFQLGRQFKPWLVSIAMNTSKSYYRRTSRRAEIASPVFVDVLVSATDVEVEGERALMEERIRAAIGRLPERLRDVVVLYYLEELSVNEVAETLRLSHENVKSRLHRARAKLRGFLEKDATEGENREY